MTDPVADYASLFRLDGRRALVIGAGSGIGAEAARGLAAFGAAVVCADLDTAAAEATAASIGAPAVAAHLDLADPASVAAAAHLGDAPDILVTTPSVNVRKRMVDYTDADLDRVIDLNLKGTFRAMTAIGRRMAEAGRGSIIAFSSIRSLTVEPGQGAYAATKAGTISLVKTLAAELAPQGVRVNAVAPGVVETPLTRPIKDRPEWYRAYADRNALRRWAQPSEMVGAVVFLASDASTYVTGATLFVDGGWTAIDGRFDPPA
jgi:NAD(P)-dependent dehydrogenase (short-subunit alcohol dehydrogenase family)